MDQPQVIQLHVCVEEIIFKNEDTGFCVLEASTDTELITVVGELASVEQGEELLLTGWYTTHPNFGLQFKVQLFERKLPTTVRAIKKFLGSGAIKGIGPAIAQRIVDQFGEDTLQIIEATPERLTEVKGISPKKAKELSGEFEQLFGVRKVMLFLERFGMKPSESVRVWSKWGPMAIEVLQNNPYNLCLEEIGLPFGAVDQIAQQLSIPQNDANRIKSGIDYVLRHNARENGHTCVPKESLIGVCANLLGLDRYEIEDTLDQQIELHRYFTMERGKTFVFLPVFYLAEQYIATRIYEMLEKEPEDVESLEAVIDLEEEACGLQYASLQRKAIREAIANDIFILTGGPGTGKTTILNAVISILEQQGYHVGICAPTGRAAKRLSEVTGQNATTIHRMLGVQMQRGEQQEFVHHEHNPLKYDAIIVDEMSMVDSLLFCSLLKAAKRGCKVVLTGDGNQLPSVSAGNVLKDLISSDCIPVVELKDIFRQSAQSLIITNAHAIVHGELPELEHTDNDFFFLGRPNLETTAKTIGDLCAVRLPKSYQYSPFDDIQVICPSRKTIIGTVELNKLIQSRINPAEKGKQEFSFGLYTFREYDKVMQVRNNYDIRWKKDGEEGQGIFNGDIGRIVKIQRGTGTLTIDFDGRLATYTFEMARELELAYAITIHKSQGNEFRAVIMPIMGGQSEFYNRNLLYTGITRAKEMLILVGSSRSVANMTNQVKINYRYTGLKYFLQQKVFGEQE